MERVKCATFNKEIQDSIPLDIREKMKADRAKAESQQLNIAVVVGLNEQLKALLEKLLEKNMCSHAGDELIEEALKGF